MADQGVSGVLHQPTSQGPAVEFAQRGKILAPRLRVKKNRVRLARHFQIRSKSRDKSWGPREYSGNIAQVSDRYKPSGFICTILPARAGGNDSSLVFQNRSLCDTRHPRGGKSYPRAVRRGFALSQLGGAHRVEIIGNTQRPFAHGGRCRYIIFGAISTGDVDETGLAEIG